MRLLALTDNPLQVSMVSISYTRSRARGLTLAAGYGPPPPQPIASPGPGKPRPNARGPPGPATPQLNSANPYPDSPAMPRPTPPPNQHQAAAMQQQLPDVGNQLVELPVDSLPPYLKREGEDWYAVFNPRVQRVLDVELVHNLAHPSVVCCVRFSRDGRCVATGCNRSAQIFDVETGQQISHLQDTSLPQDGDLYIRSVCFSPDNNHLATGAEDKIIRVSYPHSLVANTFLKSVPRSGTFAPKRSDTTLQVTSKISTRSTTLPTVVTLLLGLVTEPSVCGTLPKMRA